MTDTFDRATQVGGQNDFQVKMGGKIRMSKPVVTTTAFLEGAVLELTDAGQWQASTGAQDRLKGVAMEKKVASSIYDDLTIGSGKASCVLDEALIETRELASGLTFSINDPVYDNGAGKFTNVSGLGPLLGRCTAGAIGEATGSSGVAEIYFSPTIFTP